MLFLQSLNRNESYSFTSIQHLDKVNTSTKSGLLIRATFGVGGGLEFFLFVNYGYGIFPERTAYISSPSENYTIVKIELQSDGTSITVS
jgi:hypothetical protein